MTRMPLDRRRFVQTGAATLAAASWPSLSTQRGMEDSFDLQVEAMSRTHALTGQCFVICASSPVSEEMIAFMDRELGPQAFTRAGGGWSAIIHPFTPCLAGPHTGPEEKLLVAEIDLAQISDVKLFVDGAGHYSRPEILKLTVDTTDHAARG